MCRCINCFEMAILKFKMAAMSDLIWSPAGRDRKIRCAYRLAVWIRCRCYSFVIPFLKRISQVKQFWWSSGKTWSGAI